MRSYSTTAIIRYQPTHVDVQVAGCLVLRGERQDLQNQLYFEHVKRWNKMLKNFQKELNVCIKKEIRKHEERMKRTKIKMIRDLNNLFLYEAREVRRNRWTFDRSPPATLPIAKLLISWSNALEKERLKSVTRCGDAQKDIAVYKTTSLTKQHQQEMNFRRLEWKVKAKDHWNRIETSILASFEMEKKRKDNHEMKKQEETMKKKELELKSKLDLLLHQRNLLSEDNNRLKQELSAMQVKHRSGLAIINKLMSSFQYFIMETMKVDEEKARKLSKDLVKNEQKKQTKL